MALEYNTENKRAMLGNDASPATENTENKRVTYIYKGTDVNGDETPYLKATLEPGVYEIISDKELPDLLDESVVLNIKGITKDPSGDFYIDESKV